MQKLIASIASRLVIAVPYFWLLVFFLVPFFIVFKISLSEVAMAIPAYMPTFDLTQDFAANWEKIKQLSFDNYFWLLDDPLYYKAYLSSVRIAAISTFLTLLVAYPMAYGIARAPTTIRPTLLMLVILPCLCVDRDSEAGRFAEPVSDVAEYHRYTAQYSEHRYGGLYRYRLFLSAFHGAADLFVARKDGLFAD